MTAVTMNSAEEVLHRIEQSSDTEYLPIVGPHRGKVLVDEVRKAKPHRILEVGTLVGYSAILMGKELSEDAEIVTIEIHPDEAEQAQRNVVAANLRAPVNIVTGNALEIIPTLTGQFDFAFIDAEKSEYYQYLSLMECKLLQGAVVVADNAGIFADEMSAYLDYVRTSGKYQSRYVQIGEDGVEISIKQ